MVFRYSVYFDNCDTYNILGEPIPFKSGNVCKKEVEVSQNVHLKSWLHVKIMKNYRHHHLVVI